MKSCSMGTSYHWRSRPEELGGCILRWGNYRRYIT